MATLADLLQGFILPVQSCIPGAKFNVQIECVEDAPPSMGTHLEVVLGSVDELMTAPRGKTPVTPRTGGCGGCGGSLDDLKAKVEYLQSLTAKMSEMQIEELCKLANALFPK